MHADLHKNGYLIPSSSDMLAVDHIKAEKGSDGQPMQQPLSMQACFSRQMVIVMQHPTTTIT